MGSAVACVDEAAVASSPEDDGRAASDSPCEKETPSSVYLERRMVNAFSLSKEGRGLCGGRDSTRPYAPKHLPQQAEAPDPRGDPDRARGATLASGSSHPCKKRRPLPFFYNDPEGDERAPEAAEVF